MTRNHTSAIILMWAICVNRHWAAAGDPVCLLYAARSNPNIVAAFEMKHIVATSGRKEPTFGLGLVSNTGGGMRYQTTEAIGPVHRLLVPLLVAHRSPSVHVLDYVLDWVIDYVKGLVVVKASVLSASAEQLGTCFRL